MSAYTKGPWRIAGKGTIRAGDGWIGRIHWRNRDANARLIAATPDMYEALKNAKSLLVVLAGDNLGQFDSDKIMDAMLHEIDAAIAKANGHD